MTGPSGTAGRQGEVLCDFWKLGLPRGERGGRDAQVEEGDNAVDEIGSEGLFEDDDENQHCCRCPRRGRVRKGEQVDAQDVNVTCCQELLHADKMMTRNHIIISLKMLHALLCVPQP